MKALLKFGLLYFAVVICINSIGSFCFDLVYGKIRTGQTGGKINYYLNNSSSDLLIMGSSRAFYQAIPDSFDVPTFNLAHAGVDDAFQLGLLHVLIQDHKRPKYILLEIDPDFYLDTNEDFYSKKIQRLKYYYGKNDFVTKNIDHISEFERVKYSFSLYRYNGNVINLFKNFIQTKYSPYSGNGYEEILTEPRDSITMLATPDSMLVMGKVINRRKTRYLTGFIELCKKCNIRVFCFTSPYFFSNTSVLNEPRKYLDSLFLANCIPYVDYSREQIEQLQEHPLFWKERYHLNNLGAQIESHYLSGWFRRNL